MTERIYVNTNDINITEDDKKSVERVRKDIYDSLNGEETEIAICLRMYTPKRLDKVRNCVDSVMKYTSHIPFKWVFVNNGGGEEIQAYFESVDHPDKMIINISSNIGSPHGETVTSQYVRNKYCVELLNDCIVTSHWLDNLLKCMESDERIGMVCPMSTNVSNMQVPDMEEPDCSDLNAIQEFAERFNVSNPAKWEERMRLMPICALYRRETLEMSGFVDPGYLHEFVDDDICMRIRRAGYKLILCGDTFVHHDHFLNERNIQVEMEHTNIGKEGFIQKFKGIHPWNDFTNYVFPFLRHTSLDKKKKEYRILGIDVKCGTPILDVKNFYRQNGVDVRDLYITSYTQELKYYTDLLTVSNEVIHKDVSQIAHCIHGKYDFIVMGEIINGYGKSVELLESITRLLEEDGYLLFPLKNVTTIDTLLEVLGMRRERTAEIVENLHYWDVTAMMQEWGMKKTEIIFQMCDYLDAEIEKIKRPLLELGLIASENADIFEHWKVTNYWFLVQK